MPWSVLGDVRVQFGALGSVGACPQACAVTKKNSLVGVTCSNGRRMVRLLAELVQSRWWPHAWPHMS